MLDIIVSIVGGTLALGTFLGAGIGYYAACRKADE